MGNKTDILRLVKHHFPPFAMVLLIAVVLTMGAGAGEMEVQVKTKECSKE